MSVQLNNVVDVLFAEFQKINNKDIAGEQLNEQINRSKAIISIAKQIVETASLGLEAQKALPNMMHGAVVPPMLRIDK
jgi:hypothetical protein